MTSHALADLPKKVRTWILFTGKQPQLQVYPGWSHEEIQHPIQRRTSPPTWVALSPRAGQDQDQRPTAADPFVPMPFERCDTEPLIASRFSPTMWDQGDFYVG